jgi:hypothetical protein
MLKLNLVLVSIATSLFIFAFFCQSPGPKNQKCNNVPGERQHTEARIFRPSFINSKYTAGTIANENTEYNENKKISSLNQSGLCLSDVELIFGFKLNYYIDSTVNFPGVFLKRLFKNTTISRFTLSPCSGIFFPTPKIPL